MPAYEWWYFDALSVDGRDAVVIIFLTNFVFSPRYNRAVSDSLRPAKRAATPAQFPAVAISYYRDGRPLFRALNEYAEEDFHASASQPECRIGLNSFRLVEATSARPRYELNIQTALRGNRVLQARLEWAVEAGDFFAEAEEPAAEVNTHHWNMVAPHCTVTGEVAVREKNGQRAFAQEFRGTGYHDHNRDTRWMPQTIAEWQWGRFHFREATAVFYCYRGRDNGRSPVSRLSLIRDGALTTSAPQLTARQPRRHLFGLRYSRLLNLQSDTEMPPVNLRVRQQRVIDASFFYLRFLSEATLETADGQVAQAIGITEHLAPQSLRYKWLHWLINMRIGSGGRGAFLP